MQDLLGIDHLKDFLEVLSFIATIIGGIAILFAVRDYSISRKQLHLSVLQSCVTRFRDHFMDLGPASEINHVRDYLDLVNEELFYFEHQYLPLAVAHEWLDGMITLNMAAWYYDYENYQVFVVQNSGGVFPLPQLLNAPRVESKGIELDATLRPQEGLEFFLVSKLFSSFFCAP